MSLPMRCENEFTYHLGQVLRGQCMTNVDLVHTVYATV